MTLHRLHQPILLGDIKRIVAHVPPEILRFRAELLRTLSSEMSFVLDGGGFFCRALIGNHDSGKTMISKLLLDAGSRQACKFYVNSKMESSAYNVMIQLLRVLVPSIPCRGLSLTELVEIFLKELNGQSALITLDDVDSWLPTKNGLKLLVKLSESESQLKEGQGIYLLLTMETEEALNGLRQINPLKYAVTKLEGYSHMQLFSMLKNITEKAFYKGYVSESSLKIISKVAALNGLKQALLVLLEATRYAEAEPSTRILPRHVKKALEDSGLPLPIDSRKSRRKLVLKTLTSLLETKYEVSLKDLFKACNEALKPSLSISYAQLWRYINELGARGAITLKTISKTKGGKTMIINVTNQEKIRGAFLE